MTINRWVMKGLMLFTLFFFLCFPVPVMRSSPVRAAAGPPREAGAPRTYSGSASPSSPSPASPAGFGHVATPTTPAPQPMQQPSMWRSIAGGVMGGSSAGCSSRSLGFAGDGVQAGSTLMDIVLIGAILYFIYRFIKRRREQEATAGAYAQGGSAGTATRRATPLRWAAPRPKTAMWSAGSRTSVRWTRGSTKRRSPTPAWTRVFPGPGRLGQPGDVDGEERPDRRDARDSLGRRPEAESRRRSTGWTTSPCAPSKSPRPGRSRGRITSR